MDMAKPMVISYLRFSHPNQRLGDSQKRQARDSQLWAESRGYTITDSLSDLGVSAFRGKAQTEGALGDFLRLVRAGKIPKGTILIVESLDRLSRDTVRMAMAQFLEIINSGITIVTLADNGRIYTPEGTKESDLIMSILVMSRAHEESAIKSERLAKAWRSKRETALTKPLTSTVPAWCKMVDGKIVADKAKVKVVEKIFAMALTGNGAAKITDYLNNDDALPVLPRSGSYRRSYVLQTLRNRAVLGEYQPDTVTFDEKRQKKYIPAGEPVKGYYPAIIPEKTFYAAARALDLRKSERGPSSLYVNLFTGLLFSIHDDSSLVIGNKGRGRAYVPLSQLDKRKEHVPMASFPVKPFEEAMLLRLSEPSAYSSDNSERARELSEEIDSLTEEIAMWEGKAEEIQNLLLSGKGESASVVGLLSRLDEKRAKAGKRIEELRGELASVKVGNAGVEEVFRLMERHRDDELGHDERLALRQLFRSLVRRIDCHFEKDGLDSVCGSHIEMISGVEFDFTFRADRIEQRTKNDKGHWEKVKVPKGEVYETRYQITVMEQDEQAGEILLMSPPISDKPAKASKGRRTA